MKKTFFAASAALAVVMCLLSLAGCLYVNERAEFSDANVSDACADVPALSQGAVPAIGSLYIGRPDVGQYVFLSQKSTGDVRDAVYKALLNVETTCDISSYAVDRNNIGAVYSEIINSSPELFYVTGRLRYTYNKQTNCILILTFEYSMTPAEIATAKSEYEDFLERIVSTVPDNMTSGFDIALFVHDYICINFEYDSEQKIADAYGFFKNGKGVCQSYTLAYMAVLRRFGIDVGYASSVTMNHIWNTVSIDGKWYHVDVTWDDPLDKNCGDVPGRARHDNFLCSDEAMIKNGHSDWSSVRCTDIRFDTDVLDGVRTAFAFLDGSWYTISYVDSSIYRMNTESFELTKVLTGSWLWPVNGNIEEGYYTEKYSNICTFGDVLCFTSSRSIFALDPVNMIHSLLYTYTGDEGCIYSLKTEGESLIYTVAKTPYAKERSVRTFTREENPPETGTKYMSLDCGDETARSIFSVNQKNGRTDMRFVMIGNLSKMTDYRSWVLKISFESDGVTVRDFVRYFEGEGDLLCLYAAVNAGNDYYSAAEGYCLFGVSIKGIPDNEWQSVIITLSADGYDEPIIESRVENSDINMSAKPTDPETVPEENI